MPNHIELIDLLKQLARECLKRKAVFENSEDHPRDGRSRDLCRAMLEARDALVHVCRWINERDGTPTEDLWEVAFRVRTALGLAAYEVPMPATEFMVSIEDPNSPDGYRNETREDPPATETRRDLKAILPRLANLSREPETTPRLLDLLLKQHPGIVEALGIDGTVIPDVDGCTAQVNAAMRESVASGTVQEGPSAEPIGMLSGKQEAADLVWKPPPGFVGVKAICNDSRFRKGGKNPPRTTIQKWEVAPRNASNPPVKHKDPASNEVYYPEAWVFEQIRQWSPRKRNTPA